MYENIRGCDINIHLRKLFRATVNICIETVRRKKFGQTFLNFFFLSRFWRAISLNQKCIDVLLIEIVIFQFAICKSTFRNFILEFCYCGITSLSKLAIGRQNFKLTYLKSEQRKQLCFRLKKIAKSLWLFLYILLRLI